MLSVPPVSDDQLIEVEEAVQAALLSKTFDGLTVLGFGEIGVAIGVPAHEPVAVVKRLASCADQPEVAEQFGRIRAYEASLEPFVGISPTEHRTIPDGKGGRIVPFLIQALVPRDQLCEVILKNDAPIVDHPMVVAVRDASIATLGDHLQAIDSQFSNFAWDGNELSLFDTGSPFVYRALGDPVVELGSYGRAIPRILHPATRQKVAKVSNGLGTARGSLEHAALSAVRIGQERWLDAILETFNASLDTPITKAEVMEQFASIRKDMGLIKGVAKLQRWWLETVRRETYDFFITDSFTNELL